MFQTHYDIRHVTRYAYSEPASHCVMSLCLQPREDQDQRVRHFSVKTQPETSLLSLNDSFGNTRHFFNLHRNHTELVIIASSRVEPSRPRLLPDSLGSNAWQEIQQWESSFELWDFMNPSALTASSGKLAAFAKKYDISPEAEPLGSLLNAMELLFETFIYTPASTTVDSPIDDILETGQGVCQDYTHVLIAIARSWGIPSRYVSGYLHSPARKKNAIPANTSHAWLECMLPGLGWVGFDPTNSCIAGEGHIPVAIGRDYRDVPPTRGVLQGGGVSTLEVDVQVRAQTDSDFAGGTTTI